MGCAVTRMDDDCPVKTLLYGELDKGSRSVGRPKLRYKDICKSVLKLGRMLDNSQDLVCVRSEWRSAIVGICDKVNDIIFSLILFCICKNQNPLFSKYAISDLFLSTQKVLRFLKW